jgi:hypothetical protein
MRPRVPYPLSKLGLPNGVIRSAEARTPKPRPGAPKITLEDSMRIAQEAQRRQTR